MKYLTKPILVCVAALASVGMNAQTDEDFGSATITDEFCVSIDTESEISEYYEIDIHHLDLPSEKVANDKFGYISNNLLTYTVDFAVEKAYLQIHLDRTPEAHDVFWWNGYINSLCGL